MIKTAFLTALILVQCYDLKDVLASKHAYFTGTEGDMQGQVYNEILKNNAYLSNEYTVEGNDSKLFGIVRPIMDSMSDEPLGVLVFSFNKDYLNKVFEESIKDNKSEAIVQQAIDNLMDKQTVIAIAHRLSTLKRMDRVIFIEDGKIAEEGSFDELASKKNGKFAKLWKMQQLENKD